MLAQAAVLADDLAAPPSAISGTSVGQLQSELALAQQEIAALRATGGEMQRSLETRDAALAELRSRITALLAAADARAERLTAEREQALARVAVLQRQLAESGSGATDPAAASTPAALELAVLKAQPAPLPTAKTQTSLTATHDATGAVDAAPPGHVALAQAMAARLADVRGVEVAEDGRLILAGAALFAPGQARLSAAGREQLDTVAQRLAPALAQLPADPSWVLHVDGHTDDTPVRRSGFASNQELSLARARVVAELLAQGGVSAQRLVANGLADTRPLVTGETEAARSRNRRIELWLSPP
jgi:chemotaxis protein MotB